MACTDPHGHLLPNCLPYWEGKSTKSHDSILCSYYTAILCAPVMAYILKRMNYIMIKPLFQSHIFVQLYGIADELGYRAMFWFPLSLKTPATCMRDI
jgi:hypothetical protein